MRMSFYKSGNRRTSYQMCSPEIAFELCLDYIHTYIMYSVCILWFRFRLHCQFLNKPEKSSSGSEEDLTGISKAPFNFNVQMVKVRGRSRNRMASYLINLLGLNVLVWWIIELLELHSVLCIIIVSRLETQSDLQSAFESIQPKLGKYQCRNTRTCFGVPVWVITLNFSFDFEVRRQVNVSESE